MKTIVLLSFSHFFLKDRKVTHFATSDLSARRTGGKKKRILVFMGKKKKEIGPGMSFPRAVLLNLASTAH